MRAIRGISRVEQLNRKFGVGESEHRTWAFRSEVGGGLAALFYAVNAQGGIFPLNAQGKGAGGAGLDFDFAADEFDGDGL